MFFAGSHRPIRGAAEDVGMRVGSGGIGVEGRDRPRDHRGDGGGRRGTMAWWGRSRFEILPQPPVRVSRLRGGNGNDLWRHFCTISVISSFRRPGHTGSWPPRDPFAPGRNLCRNPLPRIAPDTPPARRAHDRCRIAESSWTILTCWMPFGWGSGTMTANLRSAQLLSYPIGAPFLRTAFDLFSSDGKRPRENRKNGPRFRSECDPFCAGGTPEERENEKKGASMSGFAAPPMDEGSRPPPTGLVGGIADGAPFAERRKSTDTYSPRDCPAPPCEGEKNASPPASCREEEAFFGGPGRRQRP